MRPCVPMGEQLAVTPERAELLRPARPAGDPRLVEELACQTQGRPIMPMCVAVIRSIVWGSWFV